jgi:hypothetical protein
MEARGRQRFGALAAALVPAAALALAAALVLAGGCGFGQRGPAEIAPAIEPPAAVSPRLPPCLHIARIEVSRSQRLLRATCERGGLLELRVALGRASDGAKRSAGDARTPEGLYRVSGPPKRSRRFHLFIPIDYPSVADSQQALADGRVSPADHRRILNAHERGAAPPGDTPLGGEIGFHGEGERWRGDSEHLDWTFGCIAMSDADVERLAELISVGTPVVIGP